LPLSSDRLAVNQLPDEHTGPFFSCVQNGIFELRVLLVKRLRRILLWSYVPCFWSSGVEDIGIRMLLHGADVADDIDSEAM
jgi:hypothetical protein